ncbi:hypothetical protein [Luteolibacter marinus]|uniref:hypothetical protein n=1 Tax=Luteolibacter marinus TaxID=2776705 RepID=UPI001865CE0D|nr:hypothetical protein [Luteolibacter marinus]
MKTLIRTLRAPAAIALGACLAPAGAFELDFEGLPAGTVAFELSEGAGISGGPAGTVGVNGYSSAFGFAINPVLIFDSANPTGGDDDLGTPNEIYAGPGIGAPGATNGSPLGNIAIIAEDLVDNNGDDLIDDPDDADRKGSYMDFDFSTLGKGKGKKAPTVTVNSLTFIDIEAEQGEAGTYVELSGPGLPTNLIAIPPTGDNGVASIDGISLAGVTHMRVNLNGSGSFAGGTFNQDEGGDCWFTFGGFQNAGIQSGGKDFTFGGNVGPPSSGSIEVVDHNNGDNFHTNDVHIVECFVVDSTGPGQPGGKKGFVANAATFAGTGRLNGKSGYELTGMVIDAGEPAGKKGHDKDYFQIIVTDPNNGDAVVFEASGYLDGGNVQLHPPK